MALVPTRLLRFGSGIKEQWNEIDRLIAAIAAGLPELPLLMALCLGRCIALGTGPIPWGFDVMVRSVLHPHIKETQRPTSFAQERTPWAFLQRTSNPWRTCSSIRFKTSTTLKIKS